MSPASSIPAINEILVTDENNTVMEISIPVPNLRDYHLTNRLERNLLTNTRTTSSEFGQCLD